MKTFKLNMIVRTIWLAFLLIPTATTLHASDLEIYKGNSGGNTTIFMMLDTSGSMGWGSGYGGSSQSLQADYGVCVVDSNGNGGSKDVTSENSSTTPVYKRYYCSVSASTYNNLSNTYKTRIAADCTPNGTGYKCYDRLTRLKDAMFTLLGNSSLTTIKLGAGYYSYDGKGQKGIVSMPAKLLSDSTHLSNLKKFVAGLVATGGTPTAAAYTEAGAYMMGTTTSGIVTESVPVYKDMYVESPLIGWRKCTTWASGNPTLSENGYYYRKCTNNGILSELSGWASVSDQNTTTLINNGYVITRYTGWFDSDVYAEKTTETFNITTGTDSVYSGFSNAGKYITGDYTSRSLQSYSPISDIKSATKYVSPITDTSSCSGNGIYFLTDGYPNGTEPKYINDLMNFSLKNSSGTNTINLTEANCSSGLSSSGSSDSNGSAWECIGEYSKALVNTQNPKGALIKTAVVGFGSSFAGLTQTNGVYNCDSVTSKDIQNTCKWGSNDYGTGGFYLASSSSKIVESMTQFVDSLKVDFKPSSIGTISIPRDPLDATKSMNTGFFPMIQPTTDTSRRTWLGNLKKYYVLNGTLKDSATGGDSLYNNDQSINSEAKDIWSIQSGEDHSLITSGGALNKIPVPSNLNLTGEPSNATSARRVFIIDNNTLKRVSRESLAVDYPSTSTNPGPLTSTTTTSIAQRYALLNYLGYKTTYPPAADATLNTADLATLAPVPANPYRFLGGVVHSSPLVVTKQAKVYSTVSGGQITESAARDKTEYVVYGSMDGGLHIVDAASGLEQSVFVPREILDNQPETLASTEATGIIPTGLNSALAYGVDAPWVADNTFKATSTKSSGTTTTTYTALTMNVYGGLRMGGSALYGLNISTPTSPTLLFRITPSTSGFSRMGQIWNKPVVAYVRYNKVRTKVLIFGGGYDEAYETTYKTSNPTGSTTTKGNAVYIVKADDGTLLWSGSSDSTAGKNLQNSNMKYSIVGQPAVRDYNADGLVDAIWVADLGGQVFRIDLNNAIQNTSTFSAVRIATLAQLNSNLRFYERPATAVFEEGQNRFILVSVGSGNRSFPLQKDATINKVYGLIDKDATADNLENTSYTIGATIIENDLVTSGTLGKPVTSGGSNPTTQISATDVVYVKNYVKGAGTQKKGWAFSLKGVNTSTESGTATDGYAKAFEEPQLLSANLYFSIFDPNATLTGAATNSCTGGVRGLSTIYRMCMPYGDCAAYSAKDSTGIIGIPIGPVGDDPRITRIVTPDPTDSESCIGNCSTGPNTQLTGGTGFKYTQGRSIRPIRWYEW